jgi:hypothetical protein
MVADSGSLAEPVNGRPKAGRWLPPRNDVENFVDIKKDPSMKLVLTLLGVVLLVVAAVYFLLPADQLPGFFPGHEAGVSRMHYKHGIVAGVVGVVLLAAGGWLGRR